MWSTESSDIANRTLRSLELVFLVVMRSLERLLVCAVGLESIGKLELAKPCSSKLPVSDVRIFVLGVEGQRMKRPKTLEREEAQEIPS